MRVTPKPSPSRTEDGLGVASSSAACQRCHQRCAVAASSSRPAESRAPARVDQQVRAWREGEAASGRPPSCAAALSGTPSWRNRSLQPDSAQTTRGVRATPRRGRSGNGLRRRGTSCPVPFDFGEACGVRSLREARSAGVFGEESPSGPPHCSRAQRELHEPARQALARATLGLDQFRAAPCQGQNAPPTSASSPLLAGCPFDFLRACPAHTSSMGSSVGPSGRTETVI